MKKLYRAAAVIAAIALSVAVCSCVGQENRKNHYKQFYAMGTVATLLVPQTVCSEEQFAQLSSDMSAMLYSADSSLSTMIETSDIYKFNEADAGEKVPIDKTAYDVLFIAKKMYDFTNGFYNPAVYHSVKAFGFPLWSNAPTLPSEQKIEAFRDLASHFGELELTQENGKYYAAKPGYTVTVEGVKYSLAVDLGGIGKGWCADRVDEMLSSRGYEYGYFDFSSSSMAVKRYYHNGSNSYSIEPRDPRGNYGDDGLGSVWIKDVNLSTSGDYEQYYELDNGDGTKTRYCHIINPTTGMPIRTGVASVTVIGGSAAEDDALTTALSCMDKQTAVDFINGKLSDKIIIMLVLEGDKGEIITNRPEELNKINSKYALGNRVENGRIVLNDVA